MPNVNELTELMNVFRAQTPSSPAWYQVIDQVVYAYPVATHKL